MNSKKINQATNFIKEKIHFTPAIGLILGSGLGELANEIANSFKIQYSSIPGFPVSTVKGHSGTLVLGNLEGKPIIAMQGRFHYYEGYSPQELIIPIRVMKKLGVEKIILTNAAGGVNETFQTGDLMLITDHINFAFVNPLIGKNPDGFGPRFPDTSNSYDPELIKIARKTAKSNKINLREGIYQFSTGPTYETPAESKVARFLGADAVGMSTVPEVLAAVQSGMKVIGISCITNMAAGISSVKRKSIPHFFDAAAGKSKRILSHDEVMETAQRVKGKFKSLIKGIVKEI